MAYKQSTKLLPYQYRPTRNVSDSASTNSCSTLGVPDRGSVDDLDDWEWDGVDIETEGWRLDSRLWCTCGHCDILPSIQENLCCKELESTHWELDCLPCVTNHPDFEVLCLSPVV